MCWICTVNPAVDPQANGQVILPAVLVITVIAIGTVIIFLIIKKSGCHLPLLKKSSTFDNPLFFNNEQSQPNLVESNNMAANGEKEEPGSAVTVWCKYEQNLLGHTMYLGPDFYF